MIKSAYIKDRKYNWISLIQIIHLDESSVLHFNSIFCECIDVSRHNVGLVTSQRFVEISFRCETEPLLPGIVGWREVLVELLPKTRNKFLKGLNFPSTYCDMKLSQFFHIIFLTNFLAQLGYRVQS